MTAHAVKTPQTRMETVRSFSKHRRRPSAAASLSTEQNDDDYEMGMLALRHLLAWDYIRSFLPCRRSCFDFHTNENAVTIASRPLPLKSHPAQHSVFLMMMAHSTIAHANPYKHPNITSKNSVVKNFGLLVTCVKSLPIMLLDFMKQD